MFVSLETVSTVDFDLVSNATFKKEVLDMFGLRCKTVKVTHRKIMQVLLYIT